MTALISANFTFTVPIRVAIAGASGTGKSGFIINLLENREKLFSDSFMEGIFWCYRYWQPIYKKFKSKEIKFFDSNLLLVDDDGEGFKGLENLLTEKVKPGSCLIFDDCDDFIFNNKLVANLMKGGSHHKNISILFTSQNMLCKGKWQTMVIQNLTHLVLLQDKRIKGLLMQLGQQISTYKLKDFLEIYQLAMKGRPYSYLIISFQSDANFPYYSGIFPGEQLCVFDFDVR